MYSFAKFVAHRNQSSQVIQSKTKLNLQSTHETNGGNETNKKKPKEILMPEWISAFDVDVWRNMRFFMHTFSFFYLFGLKFHLDFVLLVRVSIAIGVVFFFRFLFFHLPSGFFIPFSNRPAQVWPNKRSSFIQQFFPLETFRCFSSSFSSLLSIAIYELFTNILKNVFCLAFSLFLFLWLRKRSLSWKWVVHNSNVFQSFSQLKWEANGRVKAKMFHFIIRCVFHRLFLNAFLIEMSKSYLFQVDVWPGRLTFLSISWIIVIKKNFSFETCISNACPLWKAN